eukprot:1723191-Prymnesium_polylepis.1
MPPSVEQRFSDIGDDIWTGWSFVDCAPAYNPCRAAYLEYVGAGNSRASWDAVAVLVAVRGTANLTLATRPEQSLFRFTPGTNIITPTTYRPGKDMEVRRTGENVWTPNASAT